MTKKQTRVVNSNTSQEAMAQGQGHAHAHAFPKHAARTGQEGGRGGRCWWLEVGECLVGGALTEEKIFNIYVSQHQLCVIVRAKAPTGRRPGEKQNSEDREKEGPLAWTNYTTPYLHKERSRESTKRNTKAGRE